MSSGIKLQLRVLLLSFTKAPINCFDHEWTKGQRASKLNHVTDRYSVGTLPVVPWDTRIECPPKLGGYSIRLEVYGYLLVNCDPALV